MQPCIHFINLKKECLSTSVYTAFILKLLQICNIDMAEDNNTHRIIFERDYGNGLVHGNRT